MRRSASSSSIMTAVRAADDPDAALLAFLDSTYAAAADLGGWDRAALECAPGAPGFRARV